MSPWPARWSATRSGDRSGTPGRTRAGCPACRRWRSQPPQSGAERCCQVPERIRARRARPRAAPRVEASGVDTDFAVGEGLARLGRQEETTGPAGGEPAGEELRRVTADRFREQSLNPPPDVAQLGSPAGEHTEHCSQTLRGPEEVGDRMNPLGEDV